MLSPSKFRTNKKLLLLSVRVLGRRSTFDSRPLKTDQFGDAKVGKVTGAITSASESKPVLTLGRKDKCSVCKWILWD